MNQISGMWANKRTIGSLALLCGVLFFTYNLQENSSKLKRATTLESGIQTCFSRVNQTYTAKLLNDQNSQYLTQNFQSLTEECFAEGILNVEESLKTDLPIVAKKLSTLASNVHWFHEDSLLPANSANALAATDESRNIGSRFEMIENTKDEVLETAEAFKTNLSNQLGRDKNLFYASAILLTLMLIFEYFASTNRKISNSARENEAADELLDRGGIESVKVGEIIRVALEQNELMNCAKLFYNFYSTHAGNQVTKVGSREAQTLEHLVTPAPRIKIMQKEEVNNDIDDLWNNDGVGMVLDRPVTPRMNNFNLSQVTGKTIDILAEKIFSFGVQLKVVVPEDIMVEGKEEELDQIFYHLLASAIANSKGAQVAMQAQRLGDIVILDLQSNGKRIEEGTTSLDMKICQILLDEIDAKIKIDNVLDQLGNVTGSRVKVIFVAAKSVNKANKLVDLKIGSKKEIQQAIQNSYVAEN